MLSFVIADDHAIVRAGVRLLLEREAGFEVMAEAGGGDEAVRLTLARAPDILVLDLSMPGTTGFDVARQLSAAGSASHVLVLSMHATEAYVSEAFRSGIAGYVLKDATAGELVRAARAIARGQRYLSAPLSFERLRAYEARTAGSGDPYDRLTSRERQILQLVAGRHSNADIARLLAVSVRTVETHRSQLMAKLGVRGPQELLLYALRRGITRVDD